MSTTKHNAPLDSLALMKTVLDADQAVASRCIRGTTNWAAAIGKAVQDVVLRAQQPAPSAAAAKPECYRWERYDKWVNGWGWGDCESEYDPRLTENKQYHSEDFNNPEEVRNFRALYRNAPQSSPTPQADSAPASGNWVSADDVNRLVRQLDVALNGEAGAAVQASLCDVVAQVVHESAKLGHPLLQAPAAQQAREPRAIKAMGYGGSTGINDYLMSDGTVKAMRPAEVQWAAQADKGAPV